jgi:hypothetical protein
MDRGWKIDDAKSGAPITKILIIVGARDELAGIDL